MPEHRVDGGLAEDAAKAEDAIRRADLDWSKTAETKKWDDSTGFFSFLLDDAVYLPPNEPAWIGEEAIREKLGAMLEMPGLSAKWTPTQVHASGDLGYSIGNYEIIMTDSAGVDMSEKGKYLVVWKKQADGKWKVAAESFNANTPAL